MASARSGDYGVNMGVSAQRSASCGGTGQPACSITMNGYTASFRTVDADGRIIYSFTFWCNLVIDADGTENLFGAECDQYLSNSS